MNRTVTSVRSTRLAVLISVVFVLAIGYLLISPLFDKEEGGQSSRRASNADRAYAVDALAGRYAKATPMAFTNSLLRTMPTRLYRVNGAPPAPLSDGILVGKVTKVSPGRAFVDGATKVDEVEFDSQRATRRTILVSARVDLGWGGVVAGRERVKFAVILDGSADPERVMSGVRGFGRIVVGLERAKLSSDPELPVVSHDGGFLGTVAKDGSISLPIMAANGAAFLGEATSVAQLEAELTKPRATVALKLTARGYEVVKKTK